MIISVAELRQFVETDKSDMALEFMIQALESFIANFTHNEFKDGYPNDVKMGAINLISYDLNNRDKIGISSETISRHTVSYSSQSGADSEGGYPKALTGFLKPYMKARF